MQFARDFRIRRFVLERDDGYRANMARQSTASRQAVQTRRQEQNAKDAKSPHRTLIPQ